MDERAEIVSGLATDCVDDKYEYLAEGGIGPTESGGKCRNDEVGCESETDTNDEGEVGAQMRV